jgi:PEP-CTERM motif
MLDGSPVAITPTFIRFFSGTNGGGFAICFDGTTFPTCTEGLATDGPQMYTGTTSAPTLTAGAFAQFGLGAIVEGTTYPEDNPTTLVGTPVPEPSTALLMLTAGILALGGRRLYWRS